MERTTQVASSMVEDNSRDVQQMAPPRRSSSAGSRHQSLAVCMMTSSFYPDVGGAEFLAAELAKGLAAKDFRVCFLAREKSLPYPSWRGMPEIDFRPILATAGIGGVVKSIFKVSKAIAGERFSIFHAHYALTPGLIALPLVVFQRIPLVITSPGSDIQLGEKLAYGPLLRAADSILLRIVLRFSSIHVVLCQAMVADAVASGSNPAKVRVIYPGVYDPPVHTQSRILELLRLRTSDTVVLFLGRLVRKKAADDLVKAAPRILEALPNAKIVVAGHGKEHSNLTAMAESLALHDGVVFPGGVTETERYALLGRCNVFVIPSLVEGMPHMLLEALAFGKPIVATDIPPFREILAHSDHAVLVPVSSPEALANGVIKLAMRFQHNSRSKETPKNRFGIERMVESYVRIYAELLHRR